MRALPDRTRKRVAAVLAVLCSLGFAFQFSWLAVLIVRKWGRGIGDRPSFELEIETDVLFLISILISILATAVNDWGWGSLREFKIRLPMALTFVVVLILAIGAKSEVVKTSGSNAEFVKWIDLLQATTWLLFLGVGVRVWHRRNGGACKRFVSRKLKWVMFLKLTGLVLLWCYQGALLLWFGRGLPNWGSLLSDLLYFTGMVAGSVSYFDRHGVELMRAIFGSSRGHELRLEVPVDESHG